VEAGKIDAVGVVGGASIQVDVNEGEDERVVEASDDKWQRGADEQVSIGEEEAHELKKLK
jgi:hypothetical protein